MLASRGGERVFFVMGWMVRACLLVFALSLVACSSGRRTWTYEYRPGKSAVIVDGYAVPPAGLPHAVMYAINAGNSIVGRPYKYGGGHRSFDDWGYDCSGTVSYVLHGAGKLKSPGTSESFQKYGSKGDGDYITVYAKSGHCFIEVADLRLDTGYNGGSGEGPRWTTKPRPMKGYSIRHPRGL